LKLLRDKGAVTMVQDRDSAVVYGMPGEAIKLDAATYVLSPEQMVAGLVRLADKKGTAL
jgi:two-component system chemotaxis response regulator CheB